MLARRLLVSAVRRRLLSSNNLAVVFTGEQQCNKNESPLQALCEAFPAARQQVDLVNTVLGGKTPFEHPWFLPEKQKMEPLTPGGAEHVSVLVYHAALLAVLNNSWGKVVCVAGQSVGEFSALTLIGSMEFRDAVRVANLRGRLAENVGRREALKQGECGEFGRVELETDGIEQVEAWIQEAIESTKEQCYIAVQTSPTLFTLGGSWKALQHIEHLSTKVIRSTKCPSPMHSLMVDLAAERIGRALEQVQVHPLEIPLIGNVVGFLMVNPRHVRRALQRAMVEPIRWHDCIQYCSVYSGADAMVVLGQGAHQLVDNLTDCNIPVTPIETVEDVMDWNRYN